MKEPTAFERKMIKQALEAEHSRQNLLHKIQLVWETKAIEVIKDKMKARIKLNLYNGMDWKVTYYESKLRLKPKLLSKLKRLIK